ncbi:hypothetical protein JZ751_012462 [Albula glossodonta]|uniref:Uncharacterized protein n=1 Tax=Albula glossodonta TaxID=121402 RepID=A0A8T2NWV1_9TELE|nr:hypothetical protein JZ751_012462 [Albula glossodonta]
MSKKTTFVPHHYKTREGLQAGWHHDMVVHGVVRRQQGDGARVMDRVDRGDEVVGRGTCRRDKALSWPSLITCDASEEPQQQLNAAQLSDHRHSTMPDSLPSSLELQ